MDSSHTPQRCRWAVPTLFLPVPGWLDAWDAPWSCARDPKPRVLQMADECLTCPRWEARAQANIDWMISQTGL